jgi:hypothetical protein
MSRIDQLFTRYVEAHRRGEEADPLPYLRDVSGIARDEPAALIDRYLAEAPPRSLDPAQLERLRADPRFNRWWSACWSPAWRSFAPARHSADASSPHDSLVTSTSRGTRMQFAPAITSWRPGCLNPAGSRRPCGRCCHASFDIRASGCGLLRR